MRRKSLVHLSVAGSLLSFAGCGDRSGATPSAPAAPFSISYEIRDPTGRFIRGAGASASVTTGTTGGGKLKLEIKDGHVFANDKDYGALKNGDSVLLDADGKLTVNGEPRQ